VTDSTTVVKIVGRSAVGYGLLFAVVGYLASRKFASPQTSWAAIATLATATAAVVGIWTLIGLRRDSHDRTRPMMIAEIRPSVIGTSSAELLIRNVGPSVAKNVRFTFTPPLPVLADADAVGKTTPYLQRRYSRPFAVIGPGMELHDTYQYGGGNDLEPVPDDFVLTIAYQDDRGRDYRDSYDLSVSILHDSMFSRPNGDPQDRIADAVEAIARGVGRR
jgi:hypothetical protein